MILFKNINYDCSRFIIYLLFCFAHVVCATKDGHELYIYNVSHGAANLIIEQQTQNKCAYLIDCGSNSDIRDVVASIQSISSGCCLGIIIFCSHEHNDHTNKISVFTEKKQQRKCALNLQEQHIIPKIEKKRELADNHFIQIVETGCRHDNGDCDKDIYCNQPNCKNKMVRFKINDKNVLIMGDACWPGYLTAEQENMLKDVDYCVLPHHGSCSNDEDMWIKKIIEGYKGGQQVFIASCGNSYKLPRKYIKDLALGRTVQHTPRNHACDNAAGADGCYTCSHTTNQQNQQNKKCNVIFATTSGIYVDSQGGQQQALGDILCYKIDSNGLSCMYNDGKTTQLFPPQQIRFLKKHS